MEEATFSGAPPASLTSNLRTSPGNIRSLILEKERELHDINEYRIRTLESLLKEKETAVNTFKQKFSKLQEDFKYNLKLLEGRDEELAQYDTNFASLKNLLRDREAEISELKAQVSEVQGDLKQEKKKNNEQEQYFQQKMKEVRAQMEGARWNFDDELRRHQDEVETMRRKTEREIREKEEDLETQRREITITFDEVMRQREQEWKNKIEHVNEKKNELELKNKHLQRENDTQKERLQEMKQKMDLVTLSIQEKEKEIKKITWEINDLRNTKDSKITNLEQEITDLQEVKQHLLDEYETKMAELLQSLHSVEKAFVQQKKQYEEEITRLVKKKDEEAKLNINKMENKIETLTTKLRLTEENLEQNQNDFKKAKWEYEDLISDKERQLESLRYEMDDFQTQKYFTQNDLKNDLCQLEMDKKLIEEKNQDLMAQINVFKEKEKLLKQEMIEQKEKQEDLTKDLTIQQIKFNNRIQEKQEEISIKYETRLKEIQQIKERLQIEKQAIEEKHLHAENEIQKLRNEIYSLRSNARIMEAFGGRGGRGGTGGTGGTGAGASIIGSSKEGEAHTPSPLWSEDQGPLSPIAGVSPLLLEEGEEENSSKKKQRQTNPLMASAFGLDDASTMKQLEAENTRLKEIIREMKEAMKQAVDVTSSPMMTTEEQDQKNTNILSKKLKETEDYCALLESRIEKLKNNSSSSSSMVNTATTTNTIGAMTTSELSTTSSNTVEMENLRQRANTLETQLIEANRDIEQKSKHISLLQEELLILRNGGGSLGTGTLVQSEKISLETQVNELKRKLASAHADVERLIQERTQLMELSNQLNADLRKLKESNSTSTSNVTKSTVEFAGKKDYENLIADLSRSLEESRLNNKTLKKELRRLVKIQTLGPMDPVETASIMDTEQNSLPPNNVSKSPGRRSTLSMMMNLQQQRRVSNTSDVSSDVSSTAPTSNRKASSRSNLPPPAPSSVSSDTAPLNSVDAKMEVLRAKLAGTSPSPSRSNVSASSTPSGSGHPPRRGTGFVSGRLESSPPTRSTDMIRKKSIESIQEEQGDDMEESDEVEEEEEEEEEGLPAFDDEFPAPSPISEPSPGPSSTRSSVMQNLFTRRDRNDSATSSIESNTAKVSDARLKLQRAKKMLTLAGEKNSRSSSTTKRSSVTSAASTTGGTPSRSRNVSSLQGRTAPASSSSSNSTLKSSDRETETQKKVFKKLKDLQSKRAEMVKERQKVRNYSLTN